MLQAKHGLMHALVFPYELFTILNRKPYTLNPIPSSGSGSCGRGGGGGGGHKILGLRSRKGWHRHWDPIDLVIWAIFFV